MTQRYQRTANINNRKRTRFGVCVFIVASSGIRALRKIALNPEAYHTYDDLYVFPERFRIFYLFQSPNGIQFIQISLVFLISVIFFSLYLLFSSPELRYPIMCVTLVIADIKKTL